MKILLLAGSEASNLKQKLESLGFVVDVVDSIREALERAREPKHDLFLVYATPTKDLEGFDEIKDLNMPIVYLVDLGEFNIQEAILVPPYTRIGKPFNAKELKSAMDLALETIIPKWGEKHYKDIFKYAGRCVAVYQVTDDGKDFVFKDLNLIAERVEQVKKEHIIGRKVTEVFPEVKSSGLLEVFRRVYRTGRPEHFLATRYKDGRIRWVDNFVYKLPSDEIVVVYEDITEYKQLKEKLKRKSYYIGLYLRILVVRQLSLMRTLHYYYVTKSLKNLVGILKRR